MKKLFPMPFENTYIFFVHFEMVFSLTSNLRDLQGIVSNLLTSFSIADSMDGKGKKQPQTQPPIQPRSSVGLNYGPITSSIDDKKGGGRRPRRLKQMQGTKY